MSRLIRAESGFAVHVVHETKASAGTLVTLCRRTLNGVEEIRDDRLASCEKCRSLDDPFDVRNVPNDPTTWATMVVNPKAQPSGQAAIALINRDLITMEGVLTPRGETLTQDLTRPTPWVDRRGTIHARGSHAQRRRGLCGEEDLLISGLSYAKLRRAQRVYATMAVDCMACVAIGKETQ